MASTLPPAIDFQLDQDATPQRMNMAMTALDGRLRLLEAQKASLDTQIASLQAIGLSRINDALQPMFAVEQARIASGVLIASSETSAIVTVGETLRFLLDAAQWLSFSPSAYVALTRKSDLTDHAILHTTTYDPTTGLYTGVVIAAAGLPGPFADWELSSGAGAVTAVLQALTAALAARDTVLAAAATVATQAAAVAAINARFTVSALSPTGGNDGDIWFMI